MLCDADDWEDIELAANIRFSWRNRFIELRNGVPSHDTISRDFYMIRDDAFQDIFLVWLYGLNFGSDGLNVVAVDGKLPRRTHDRKMFKSMLYRVAAWSVDDRVHLGSQSVD